MSISIKISDDAVCPECGSPVQIITYENGNPIQIMCSMARPGLTPKDGICACDDDLNSCEKGAEELVSMWVKGKRGWVGSLPSWMKQNVESGKESGTVIKSDAEPVIAAKVHRKPENDAPQMVLFS